MSYIEKMCCVNWRFRSFVQYIFFRGIGRNVGRSLTLLILGMPVCPWFGLARRRRSSGSKLFANFESRWEREREKERERERERERETSACIRISFDLEKYYVSVLKMILGDASHAHRLLHDKVGYSTVLMLCMLSIACPNLSWIPFGSDLDPNSDNVF